LYSNLCNDSIKSNEKIRPGNKNSAYIAAKEIPAPIAQLEHQECPQNVYRHRKVEASNGWVMIRVRASDAKKAAEKSTNKK